MSAALATLITPAGSPCAHEALAPSDWALLLKVTPRRVRQRIAGLPVQPVAVAGGIANYVAFQHLPEEWRMKLEALRLDQHCRCFADLLTVGARFIAPEKKVGETTEHNQQRAEALQSAMRVYFAARDVGKTTKEAGQLACERYAQEAAARNPELIRQGQTPLRATFQPRQIENIRKQVEAAGGVNLAPLEAYGHRRCVAHPAQRVEAKLVRKLGVTEAQLDDLIANVKERSLHGEHLSSVHRLFEIAWLMGEAVPGLGYRTGNDPFPITIDQMRGWMCSTGARRLATHGEARYSRECAPWVHRDTSGLRPLELLVLDDTRIDLIATDDRNNARLIELKAYIVMDVATRRILGFTVLPGAIGKEDVRALLARVLRAHGLPTGYAMRILFERGTIACSDAAETWLTSMWPGRIEVHRTSMDGSKRSTVADFWQSGSGHWMGKAWIESFMRTLSILLEQLPGQRGSHYQLQPAQLGLKGRDHAAGLLRYDKASSGAAGGLSTQMHEAAITGLADVALRWVESVASGRDFDTRPRLKHTVLKPKRWIIDQISRSIAWYNQTTDHNRAGLERIEYQDADGTLRNRMESANERWTRLSLQCPAERIHPADATRLLKYSGKAVTVDARQGVVFDEYPFKGLRFWKPDSLACHAAAQLATQQRKLVAIYDPEAIRQASFTGDLSPLEIHLLGDANADRWQPGDPGRYLETLPLYEAAGTLDPEALARQRADKEKVVKRQKLELVQAMGPKMLRALRDLESDEEDLRGAVLTTMDLSRPQLAESELGHDLAEGRAASAQGQASPTRASQAASNDLEDKLAKLRAMLNEPGAGTLDASEGGEASTQNPDPTR